MICHWVGFYHLDIFDHCMTTVWSSVVSGLDSKLSFSDSPWSITLISSRLHSKSIEIVLVYSILLKNRFKYRYLGFGWRKWLSEPTIGFRRSDYPRKSLGWGFRWFAEFKEDPLTDFLDVRLVTHRVFKSLYELIYRKTMKSRNILRRITSFGKSKAPPTTPVLGIFFWTRDLWGE